MTRAAAALGLGLVIVSAPVTAATIADAVFGRALMGNVEAPVTLHYRYERRGEAASDLATAPVTMEVRPNAAGDGKEVQLELFEGAARRRPEPLVANEQNPLVLVFLQRDVLQMGNLTGGAAGYFQAQIRKAFTGPTTESAVEIEVGGVRRPATRLTITPFKNDPRIDRFPQFRDKAYEFTVADDIPGGLWRIATTVPDPVDGRVILQESMTFERAAP